MCHFRESGDAHWNRVEDADEEELEEQSDPAEEMELTEMDEPTIEEPAFEETELADD
jgi:hypothetical protein